VKSVNLSAGETASGTGSRRLTRRKSIGLVLAAVAIILIILGFTYQVPVDHINERTAMPAGLMANPVFAAVATNTTGNIGLTLTDFNYTSPDGTTKLSANSATITVIMTPTGGGSTNLNLTLNLSGANIKSPQFTGTFSSLKMTGYVVVDPQTNQLVLSLVATTSVAGILQAVLGV
jgi:hypothetical protein